MNRALPQVGKLGPVNHIIQLSSPTYTAVLRKDAGWWIGWVEEIPGVNSQGQTRAELLKNLHSALREALSNLRRHSGRSARELGGEADLRWIVERGLHLCVQNALDIATHLAAASGLDSPDYATAIDRLAELGVLSQEFASRLRPMAGFRNVLVHGYLQVDLNVLAYVLHEKLKDLDEFAVQVEAYIAGTLILPPKNVLHS